MEDEQLVLCDQTWWYEGENGRQLKALCNVLRRLAPSRKPGRPGGSLTPLLVVKCMNRLSSRD